MIRDVATFALPLVPGLGELFDGYEIVEEAFVTAIEIGKTVYDAVKQIGGSNDVETVSIAPNNVFAVPNE